MYNQDEKTCFDGLQEGTASTLIVYNNL